MLNEKIFENIMSQFYLDEDEDENNGTNSKKENNTSNHKNVSSMTNESDEDIERKLSNMYNENEDQRARKDKFIKDNNINENEQKSDENENQLQKNYKNNIDSNIYENIIEEKNENDDSINKNNEYFENLEEEDNGIDSFRPKQEQKSPEFINKNFSIYNKNTNSNINNKKNVINNSCNNMNNFTETIKTKIEGDLSIKNSIRINSINEKFNNNFQYTHNPNIISLGKISNKESDSAIQKNNNDRKTSDESEEQKEQEFLIREELIRKKYKEKMALEKEKENRKVKNRINLLKNDDDEGKENVSDDDEETTKLEYLSIEEKKKNFGGNEENNYGTKIGLNLNNSNYNNNNNNKNKKYNEDIIISNSNQNTNRNRKRNNDIKIKDMPIKLLNQYINVQDSNKKQKRIGTLTANSSIKKNNKISNSFLAKNEYNKEKTLKKGKTKKNIMNTPIKINNNQNKRNNNIKKTEIKIPSSIKNFNCNFSSDNIKNSTKSFHINSNKRNNNIKNDRIISKKLTEKYDIKNIKKKLYPYNDQKNTKKIQKTNPSNKTPRPRKQKNSTDYYQNCTFTPNINKISIKLWKKRNKNLEKNLMISPNPKIEENNIEKDSKIKRSNKRAPTPIGDLLYEDANYKKEKKKQVYLTENKNIKYNANIKKINRNSYDMVIERINKRINNIINKYSKDDQLSIVNIVQCLYDLKIINEIIKNNSQNIDLNFKKLKNIVNNIKEKDYKKLDELEILEQLWLIINPFKQKNINSKLFFEFLKILFSSNDININHDKIKEMSSNIEIILKNNIYEYNKREYIDSYITPLTDNRYEKKDLWSIPKLIKKFLVLKNNIIAYKNTDYEYKKEEINQKLKEEDEKELTFEPNLAASNYTFNRYSKYLPYENFDENLNLTDNYDNKSSRHDFNKTYERFMQAKKAHEKVLEKLREIKLNKELQKCKNKPEINKCMSYYSIRRNKSFDLKDSNISYKNIDNTIPVYERLYKMRKINCRDKTLKNSKSENFDFKHNLMIKNYRNKNRVKISSSNINEINKNKNNSELNNKNKVEDQKDIKIDNIYITIEIKIPNGQLKPLKIYKNQSNTNEKVNEFCGMYDIDEKNKNLLLKKVLKYYNIFFGKNIEEDNDCILKED